MRLLTFSVVCCTILMPLQARGDAATDDETAPPSSMGQQAAEIDGRSLAPPSSATVEQAISALQPPLDQQQLSDIFAELNRLTDLQERNRLQQLLDAKMRTMLEPPPGVASGPTTSSSQLPTAPPLSEGDLRVRIDALNLGPSATADELRARDQIVSAIAGLQDPVLREELLRHLEEREHQSGNGS